MHIFLQLFENETRLKQGSSQVVVQRCSAKKVSFKSFSNSQKNTPKASNSQRKILLTFYEHLLHTTSAIGYLTF